MREHAEAPLSDRLSWDEVHHLELTVRMRARSLAARGPAGSRCPGCGRAVGDDGMRVAGVVVHPDCLFGEAQSSSSSAARKRSFSSRVP